MSIERRDAIITGLEDSLKTRIICYLTGDRPGGMETQIGSDVIPRFRRHLEAIGDVESITLFLYSRGGDTNAPWRLVNLVREYCRQFNVLVPFRAHSAATLLSLGADRIIMGRMGELSSIDPSVANPFNPPDPANPAARVPISVEDVNAYRDLARRFGVKDGDARLSADVFLALASKVDPLALGNVERSYNQIRKLASDMLHLHMKTGSAEEEKVQKVVKILTEQLYSHVHLINRREASRLGLNVEDADKTLDAAQWELFSEYSEEMELERAFNAPQLLGNQPSLRVELKRAFIESRSLTDVYVTDGSITRPPAGTLQLPPGIQLPPGVQAIQVAFQIESDGWKVLR
jgi:hypothetical protein